MEVVLQAALCLLIGMAYCIDYKKICDNSLSSSEEIERDFRFSGLAFLFTIFTVLAGLVVDVLPIEELYNKVCSPGFKQWQVELLIKFAQLTPATFSLIIFFAWLWYSEIVKYLRRVTNLHHWRPQGFGVLIVKLGLLFLGINLTIPGILSVSLWPYEWWLTPFLLCGVYLLLIMEKLGAPAAIVSRMLDSISAGRTLSKRRAPSSPSPIIKATKEERSRNEPPAEKPHPTIRMKVDEITDVYRGGCRLFYCTGLDEHQGVSIMLWLCSGASWVQVGQTLAFFEVSIKEEAFPGLAIEMIEVTPATNETGQVVV